MKQFLKQLIFDIFLFICIAMVFLKHPHPAFENLLIFVVWVMGIIGVILGFAKDTLIKDPKMLQAARDKIAVHRWWSAYTPILEILALAALGFYWTATIYTLGVLFLLPVKQGLYEAVKRERASEHKHDDTQASPPTVQAHPSTPLSDPKIESPE